MRHLTAAIVLSYITAKACAQSTDFAWGFQNGETSIDQCQEIEVGIYDTNRGNKNVNPPYFAFFVPENGIGSIQAFGRQARANIQINYPEGTALTIGFVDAFSNFGGWSNVYTVGSSPNSGCLSDVPSSSPVKVSLNTTSVSACGVVGIQASGGTPPYTMTVLPFGSVALTYNVTLPQSDDWLSWVNDVQPGSTMSVLVRDSVGNYAEVGGPISTSGSAQTCSFTSSTSDGRPSTPADSSPASGTQNSASTMPSSTASSSEQTGGAVSSNGGSGSSAGAIAGGVVGGVAALALIAALLFWLLRRRRNGKDERGRYSAAYRGHSPPQTDTEMMEDGPPASQVTPFALSSTGASQGHQSRTSLSESSRPMSHQHQHTLSGPITGFRLANPDQEDATEDLTPPEANRFSDASLGQRSRHSSWNSARGPLPAPGGAGFYTGDVPTSKADLMRTHAQGVGSSSSQVTQHQDAGPIPDTGNAEDMTDLPPSYGAQIR